MKKFVFQNNNNVNKNCQLDNMITKFTNLICNKHNKEYSIYCKTCFKDICFLCQDNHINHNLINYKNFYPKKEEINLLLDSIKKYNDNYNKLLYKIISWRKEIDRMIIYFQEQLKNNQSLNKNIDFISNCNYFNMNYISIIKFRQIYSNVIGPKSRQNNNKILNVMTKEYEVNENFCNENKMGLFDFNKYSMVKFCMDKILGKTDEFNFLNNSNYIIKILLNVYTYNTKNENIDDIFNKKKFYNKNHLLSLSDNNLLNKRRNSYLYNNFNEDKQNNSIIEKIIDFSNRDQNQYKSKKSINKPSMSLYSKVGNIFLEPNKLILPNNENNDSFVYYKKSPCYTPKVKRNLITFNSVEKISEKAIYCRKKSYNKKRLIKRNNSNQLKKNFIKKVKISNLKIQNKIYFNKEKKVKTYIHKKFDTLNINQIKKVENNLILYSPKIQNIYNKKNKLDKDSNISFYENKINRTFTESDSFKESLNFESINKPNNINSHSFYRNFSYNINNIKNHPYKRKYNTKTYDSSIQKRIDKYNFKIIKSSFNKKYIINPDIPLYLGIELNNNNCKLSIFNQNNKTIELFCFKENCYSIPTIISFNDDNDYFEIGHQAYENLLTSPDKTIFNIMKVFGKNYNEITFNKNLYPYKIYNGKSSRPYIKIDSKDKKIKRYNFEDLFTMYMEQLFQIFFNEVEIESKDENIKKKPIQIILTLGVSDNLNYFQRKIIEKIFQIQIFPEQIEEFNTYIQTDKKDNTSFHNSKSSTLLSTNSLKNKSEKKLYGGYQIVLKNIKIQNCSSIASICLKPNNEKDKNILLINANGDSINLSVSSLYKKRNEENEIKYIYEIKKEDFIEMGIEDFIDKYIGQKSGEIKEICRIRKFCYDFVENINKNSQDNLLNDNNIKLDFIKSLNNIYNQTVLSIEKLFKNDKINKNNINNILLIGTLSKNSVFIQMLKNLFRYNEAILNYLKSLEKIDNLNENKNEIYDDFLIAAGASIQSYYLEKLNSKYSLVDICPVSFGIESLDGEMDFLIVKGDNIPKINQKFIKIKNNKDDNSLEIKIYEGENKQVIKNKYISNVNIDKNSLKKEKLYKYYIELLIQFEIDNSLNLRLYLLESQTLKRRIEFLINFDIIRG